MQRNDKLETFLRQHNVKFDYDNNNFHYSIRGKVLMQTFRDLMKFLDEIGNLLIYVNGDLIIH